MSKSNSPLNRESIFDPDFRTDLTHWISVDRKVALRVMDLVDAVMRDPFNGIGKPEPLNILVLVFGHAVLLKSIAWFI